MLTVGTLTILHVRAAAPLDDETDPEKVLAGSLVKGESDPSFIKLEVKLLSSPMKEELVACKREVSLPLSMVLSIVTLTFASLDRALPKRTVLAYARLL